jgi:signal transduction histidine kinase
MQISCPKQIRRLFLLIPQCFARRGYRDSALLEQAPRSGFDIAIQPAMAIASGKPRGEAFELNSSSDPAILNASASPTWMLAPSAARAADAPMSPATLARLAARATRAEATRLLARELGVDEVIFFFVDSSGAFRPLPAGDSFFVCETELFEVAERARRHGSAAGRISASGREAVITCCAAVDGSVVACIGGDSADAQLRELVEWLPLLSALVRAEEETALAMTEAAHARRLVEEASAVAESLAQARTEELREALSVAESAMRARDQFLATVSHELRTPLTSMLGWLQLLRDEHTTAAELREALDTIESNARAQSRLVEDILDFSRISDGKLRLQVAPIDLRLVVRDAVDIVLPGADAKGILLGHAAEDDSPKMVSGDGDRLRQIVWNLLSNAVKFTGSGGRILVRLRSDEGHATIDIVDTGRGIDASFLPHVFDRFSQADSSSTRRHAGLGLGLSIVRHLVELHGGSVSVSSDGLDLGSTFSVRLPLLR